MAGRIVYVSCADECEIGVFRMDPESGHLKQVATTLIPGLNTASPTSPLAISPNRRFLYAALRLPPFPVSSFSIDPTDGTLALLGTALLPDSMAYITTDRAGGWLLGASYASGIVSASAIGMNGLVRAPAAQIAKTPPKAHSVILDAANRFAYAACLGGDALLCWAFNAATGLVAPDAPRATSVRAGSGPRHLAFGRGGEVLYAINELDGTIDVFGRDPNSGVLDARQTAATLEQPAVGDAAAADIHLTPDGRFLYASIRRDSVIAAFFRRSRGRDAHVHRPICRRDDPAWLRHRPGWEISAVRRTRRGDVRRLRDRPGRRAPGENRPAHYQSESELDRDH